MKNFGFIETELVNLDISIANPMENGNRILEKIKEVTETNKKGKTNIQLLVFPELSLTGASCGDLFYQSSLLEKVNYTLAKIATLMENFAPLTIIGTPLYVKGKLFNCAAVFSRDGLLGIVPKTYLSEDDTMFVSGKDVDINEVCFSFGSCKFGNDLLFKDTRSDMIVGINIGTDMFAPIPPSVNYCLNGANVIVNIDASKKLIGSKEKIINTLKVESERFNCVNIYNSIGKDDSTTNNVYSNLKVVANNGDVIFDEVDTFTNVFDLEIGNVDRMKNKFTTNSDCRIVSTDTIYSKAKMTVNEYPFLTEDMATRTKEIIEIQAIGLAQRMKKIHCEKVILGVSGGSDSTLALLVIMEAYKMLGLDTKNIIGVTMPCFGTTKTTLDNSLKLMKYFDIDSREISIKNACIQHLKDIGHPLDVYDVTYENVQARERTQVLMDLANQENALVIGTGDLSELALGWCTYNGDHMSMYSVNASIPKTLVRPLIQEVALTYKGTKIHDVLMDIYNTPISPELLPPNEDGTIAQKTEESIGSYVIHDFVLYYMCRYGFSPTKIFTLYKNIYTNPSKKFLKSVADNMYTFYRRFFTQQFKRNCVPDGAKVGRISLSPRGDWTMPSDACGDIWLKEIEDIQKIYR